MLIEHFLCDKPVLSEVEAYEGSVKCVEWSIVFIAILVHHCETLLMH